MFKERMVYTMSTGKVCGHKLTVGDPTDGPMNGYTNKANPMYHYHIFFKRATRKVDDYLF